MRIVLSISVSVKFIERSFSKLKRTKNNEKWLTELAFLSNGARIGFRRLYFRKKKESSFLV